MFVIEEYLDHRGNSTFAQWFHSLGSPTARKVRNVLSRMEAGNLSDVKALGRGVFERRIDFGPGYRIYFGRVGPLVIILLGGGAKDGQQQDIRQAQERWDDYKRG